MKLNFNFSGKTLLKDWWKIVRDNFTAIQTDHNELSDSVNTHKTAEVIDHPDKSVTSTKIADKAIHTEHIANYAITKDKVVNGAVTTDKIADKSITVNKLALDIVADLGKANTFLYSDGEPICLSEYKNTSGGYEVPDIPVNVFFKLENDTDSILTKFQTADDHYTTLSCDIAPGEVRICVLIQKEVSGADPQNGYLFVLDDNSIRKLLNDKAPTNHASGATTYGVGNASNYGHLKLSDSTTSTSSTSSGIAATPRAVKTAYDKVVDVDNKADNIAEDMATMQKELKAKISDINTELTTDNLFYDLSKYVNSDNTLVTDDSGVQYLSYSGSFENGAYLYHNFVVDNFRRKPKTETTLELTFDVASRHIAVDGCDSGGLNIGETDVLITYTDTTTETFGQSYYTATDTGDKTITINGTSETYKTTKFKIEIPVKNKEIKSISFRIVSDNYYTNGDPTGNACKQKTLIQSAVCYDDECVAILRDDINANTSKITANTTKITEIDKTVTDIAKHQIFVVCDGDHDELKLQAAIDSAPYKSIIYPVGELCVITNANMKSGYGMTGTNNGVAIPLKGGMTLDGSMCDTIMFKNTNPAEKQYIFHLPGGAILRNVNFCEDTDTVTADTVNPTVLYALSDSKIMHCIFYDIFGTHQFSTPTFQFGTVLFAYNDISSFNGAPANNLTNEIIFGANSIIVGNTFNDITQKKQSLGNMLVVNRSLFQNNYMGGFDNCNITLSGSVVGNIIKSFDDCSIKITGEFVANDISVVAQNTKTSFLSTTPYTIISGNVMKSISIENEYINIIECSSYAVISGNYFYVGSIPATGECTLLWSAQRNVISDNIFRTGTPVKDNSDFAIIDGDDHTVVKDNLTNATSLGTFEDTCVVEGNVTGGEA